MSDILCIRETLGLCSPVEQVVLKFYLQAYQKVPSPLSFLPGMETTPHPLFPEEAAPFSLFPMTLSILIFTVQVFDPLLGSLIPLLYLNQRSSDLKTQKNGIATAKENRLFCLFNDAIGNIINRFKKKGFQKPTGNRTTCKGADGITPPSVSNPIISDTGGAKRQTKVRGQAHFLSLNSISYCLCQVQNLF